MKIKYLPLVLILLFISFIVIQNKVNAAPNDVVTICHATGSNTFIRLVVSENAIGGHFENPGTPKSGHEDDILLEGDVACPGIVVSPTSTPSISPSPTLTPTNTPTFTPTVTPTLIPSVKPSITVKPSKSPTPTKKPKPSKIPKPTGYPGSGGVSGNVCTIINTIGVSQNTGNNNANQNTGGEVSLLSGNTNVGIGISNNCGSNYALVGSVGSGSTNVNISDNGAGSLNSVLINNQSSVKILQ